MSITQGDWAYTSEVPGSNTSNSRQSRNWPFASWYMVVVSCWRKRTFQSYSSSLNKHSYFSLQYRNARIFSLIPYTRSGSKLRCRDNQPWRSGWAYTNLGKWARTPKTKCGSFARPSKYTLTLWCEIGDITSKLCDLVPDDARLRKNCDVNSDEVGVSMHQNGVSTIV